jgi:carbon-monoxide dehydrogenase medium subunit
VTTLPPFTVHRAGTVEQASELLDSLGEDGVVYCGGTELLLVYKLGFADQPDLVDVKHIEELRGIAAERDELRIGAAMTHREIERSPIVEEHFPALARMERHVGNVRVRSQGTIGGNLCFADPHSDPATFLIAAGGEVSIRRGGAPARRMAVEDFVRGPYETALEPGELLIAVHVPRPRPGSALVHRKMSFHERPAITVAVRIAVEDGTIGAARVAVGSVGVRPVRVPEAEESLTGLDAAAPDAGAVARAGEAAARASAPVTDANGSEEYKRHLVAVLSGRCVQAAAAEARGA